MAMTKFINKMGVEIEGAWYNGQPYGLKSDSSVRARADYHGESVSDPIGSFRELTKFITDNYPEEKDESCGLHVHFSFNSLGYYSMLMDKGFMPYFSKFMKEWGETNAIRDTHFWERLNDRNRFCRREVNPDQQVIHRDRGYSRYTQWNYAWGVHKTAECRVLPVFASVKNAVKAVSAVRRCVGLWLGRVNKPGELESVELPMLPPEPEQLIIPGSEDSPFNIQPLIIKEISCV
jgi:hypothetical protein